MDPAVKQAAESLALGELKTSIPLTETQQALKIPSRLVYICGLVVTDRNEGGFTQDQTEFFRHLQTICNNSAPVYRLSLTLLPRKDAQAVVHADLLRRQSELAIAAHIAAEKLLREEEESRSKPSTEVARNTSRPRPVQVTQESHENACHSRVDDDDTLEDLMKPPVAIANADELSSSDWTEVKTKKSKQQVEKISYEEKNAQGSLGVPEGTGTAAAVEESLAPTQTPQGSSEPSNKVFLPRQECRTSRPLFVPETMSAQLEEKSILRTRVRQLELDLAAKDEQLRKERATHIKAFNDEQEAASERVQALQLRLYISETRLKTFEEALQQHVQAVSNNLSTCASPTRQEKDELPLYSRVLGDM